MKWIKKLMFLSMALAIMSCSDDDSFTEDPGGEDPDPDPIEENEVGKKGVAFTNNAEQWSHRTSDMKAHWMYSWGNVLREEIPENVEYVPMIWGRGAAQNDEVINRLKDLKNEGKIKYLLGFNEPDAVPQANMSVDEAIELWPKLEEVGVPLGSPATVNPNNAWMQEFMQRADAEGLRVDFICVHNYGGGNATNFINMLSQTYQNYGERPIWITEFAVADWTATSPENNRHSRQDVINFMEQILPALEQIDYVERYAWFDGTQAPLYTSSLFDEDLNITSVGQNYAEFSPNNEIGPGMDTDFEPEIPETPEGEYFVNGGFESGDLFPWGGFKGEVFGPGSNPLSGNFCVRLEAHDAALTYDLVDELEPGETYILEYNFRWQDTPPQEMVGRIRDFGGDNDLLFTTEPLEGEPGEWTYGSLEFTMPDEFSDTIRFVFFKPQVSPQYPQIFFDDMSLRKKED